MNDDRLFTVKQWQDKCAEVLRLRKWVADLQSGMFVNCVYCGHRYGPADKVPATMADALKAHIETCPAHPMSALKTECDALRKAVETASHALRSYQYGNASTELAKETADALDAAIKR